MGFWRRGEGGTKEEVGTERRRRKAAAGRVGGVEMGSEVGTLTGGGRRLRLEGGLGIVWVTGVTMV